MYAYLATELEPATLPADFDENIAVVPVSLGDVEGLLQSGEIKDLKTIASLLMAFKQVGAR